MTCIIEGFVEVYARFKVKNEVLDGNDSGMMVPNDRQTVKIKDAYDQDKSTSVTEPCVKNGAA